MLPHQERVVSEKKDLDYKIDRLKTFLGSDLVTKVNSLEVSRMTRQLAIMKDYSAVLTERIASF
ncbi:hypothetical protein HY405_01600 [Candidatus Microgenomates bacterium]|nr:hypothetical protein [Candidatus Microgenomates bacterium]